MADRIPYTRRCTEGLSHKYTTVPIILTAVNDTLIFFTISYRLVSISMVSGTWRARAMSFIRGDGLHHLSKALLQSGQVYYLSVIVRSVYVDLLRSNPDVKCHHRSSDHLVSSHSFSKRSRRITPYPWHSIFRASKRNGMSRIPRRPPRYHQRASIEHY